jgi:hypothetical protein
MTFTEEQVERIVLEVLRRLGVARNLPSANPSPPGEELQIAERVVTMRSIEGRLNGVPRIVVKWRAVVTPAVKDELKQRRVELIEAPE